MTLSLWPQLTEQSAMDSSREIITRALAEHSPYATVLMMSGGNDSKLADYIAQELGVKIDFILHGITGTGIKQTTDFVRDYARNRDATYIEADAGDAYERYVLRKGFFGRGKQAHSFSYHVLKHRRFRTALSHHIRQGQRGRKILLINGARMSESSNRAANLSEPIRADGPNIWVNIAHDWTTDQRNAYLHECNAPCNPVTRELCRSGECLCGTAQEKGLRAEANYFFPDWGKWLNDLENRVHANGFEWGWGEDSPPRARFVPDTKSGSLFDFQPMCHSCETAKAAP